MQRIVVFASGSGSNAQAIIDYFHTDHPKAQVVLIVCNKPNAGVVARAQKHHIPVELIDKSKFHSTEFLHLLENYQANWLVLAGFLWKVPASLVEAYEQRIINIHPSLLPLYGGKGMYGEHVHKAVLENGDKQSGITIHYVNEHYDEGTVILQAHCKVDPTDTPQSLAEKVHQLEHFYFPRTLAFLMGCE